MKALMKKIVRKLKQIYRRLNNILLKDRYNTRFSAKDVMFEEHHMVVEIACDVPKKLSKSIPMDEFQLIIRNSDDSLEEYSFDVIVQKQDDHAQDRSIQAFIPLTTINNMDAGTKWAFYIKTNVQSLGNECRLAYEAGKNESPDLKLKYRWYNETVISPYITVAGNLGLKLFTANEMISTTELPNYVTEIQQDQNKLKIAGWADTKFLQNIKNDIRILVKNRRSKNQFSFQISWSGENTWFSELDLQKVELTAGIWDVYLSERNNEGGHNYRVKFEQTFTIEGVTPIFLPGEKESYKVIPYKTKKHSLSIEIKSSFVKLKDLQSQLNQHEFSLQGKMTGLHEILPMVSKTYMIFRERNSGIISKFEVNLEADKNIDDRINFEFSIDYLSFIQDFELEPTFWDVYVGVEIYGELHRIRLKGATKELAYQSRYNIETDDNVYQMYLYSTRNKYLSMTLNELTLVRDIEQYKMNNHELHLTGYAYLDTIELTEPDTLERYLIIRARETGEEIRKELALLPHKQISNEHVNPHFRYDLAGYDVKIPLQELSLIKSNDKEILDFYIQIKMGKVVRERKLGLQSYKYYKDHTLAKGVLKPREDEQHYTLHFLTLTPMGNIKLETMSYSKEMMNYLRFGRYFDMFKRRNKDIWIIGERPDTAQDTGYHFFKYCREHFPDKPIYYAIDPESRDVKNISSLGNVLYFGTFEHLKMTSLASTFIGSHDLDYFIPFKGPTLRSYRKATKIFLQHGVLGRKNVEYHKKYYQYPFDIFCVSSKAEKEMVVRKFGYNTSEVKDVGLSRFDYLLKEHRPKREILLIPTWREWLTDQTKFETSVYFKRYVDLLMSEQLHEMLDKHDLYLNFYPHYRMQHFIDNFEALKQLKRIRVVELGEVNVQTLLKDNALMITDYSSVSFDFTYMSKPVIFYHFDRDSFFKNGILRPVEETFLGDIVHEQLQLLETLECYIANGFQEKQEVKDKKYLIFTNIDTNNCKRIYEVIKKASK
ncbi:CDP-glycerol glycerophosphotransferase family protein [Bacillus sp. PS06]|uniref:CDP-glycerol glycerophosphotransferase family protein n=1 Tax=Bacillus sp. PS06 TaxID=2764176 RepID=UPI00177B4FC6|nr:CDP-glycerol glycerophosphotransferase family protein [Bacillus sp. PS06]MBD8070557.1 CDP-glycerol glycerophosphotransferase family protein [Bacillus sp. PS06]